MPAAQVAVMSDDPLAGAIEILPDRLYYNVYLSQPKFDTSRSGRSIYYFSIDDELVYWNFFLDFGPLNLGQLYRFCTKLNLSLGFSKGDKAKYSLLSSVESSCGSSIICYYSSPDPHKRANAIFLLCAWKILFLDQTPEESFYPFRAVNTTFKCDNLFNPGGLGHVRGGTSVLQPIPPFHDASPGVCTYELTILDVLRGLAKARTYHFFEDFRSGNFELEEYEHFEMVENGDLNWIINGQFLAFAGPQYRREVSREGYVTLTPDDYIDYFRRKNVGLVVRLNKKCYDEQRFVQAGISHAEHFYLDGSVPSKKILFQVISSFEKCIFRSGQLRRTGKGVAVHCKAGLGRTGTCIGAFMMKHYKFTASEAIGWMRICRPGCVIGPQQHYLQNIEQQMWHEGDVMRLRVHRSIETAALHEKSNCSNAIDMVVEGVEGAGMDDSKNGGRRPHRAKVSSNSTKRGISSAFHSMTIRSSNQADLDAFMGHQGDALRAAHSKRHNQASAQSSAHCGVAK